jgi:hypothetical protein
MKNRRDCDCPCHTGSVVVHPVPCCDGILGYLKKKPKSEASPKKSTGNEKCARGITGDSVRRPPRSIICCHYVGHGAASMKAKRVVLSFPALCSIGLLMVACGGSNYTGPTSGPTAVLNGNSTAVATSSWVGTNCYLKFEFGADGSLISDINSDGTWTMVPATWTASGSNSATTTNGVTLTNIEGSTYSQKFSVSQVAISGYLPPEIGPCDFALQSGPLAF